jgi:hypothetical protein
VAVLVAEGWATAGDLEVGASAAAALGEVASLAVVVLLTVLLPLGLPVAALPPLGSRVAASLPWRSRVATLQVLLQAVRLLARALDTAFTVVTSPGASSCPSALAWDTARTVIMTTHAMRGPRTAIRGFAVTTTES